MALSLGVSVGRRIAVGTSIVEVRAIHDPKHMVIAVDNGTDITINDNKAHAVEILPGVRLFIGLDKHGSRSRLAFEASQSVPIHLLLNGSAQSTLAAGAHKAKKEAEAPEEGALFINGVFEDTLIDILKNQKAHPGQHHYLQPYSPSRILLLAKSTPTPEKPGTLYLSVTKSLNLVSYRAKVVGWQDKRKLTPDALASLNQHIQRYQPSEESIYLEARDGKPCVNLISIVNVERMEPPSRCRA